jgi:hypothetical protein
MRLIDEEIKILKDIKSDFILKYFDSFVVEVTPESKILYLVTEFSRVCIFMYYKADFGNNCIYFKSYTVKLSFLARDREFFLV